MLLVKATMKITISDNNDMILSIKQYKTITKNDNSKKEIIWKYSDICDIKVSVLNQLNENRRLLE